MAGDWPGSYILRLNQNGVLTGVPDGPWRRIRAEYQAGKFRVAVDDDGYGPWREVEQESLYVSDGINGMLSR